MLGVNDGPADHLQMSPVSSCEARAMSGVAAGRTETAARSAVLYAAGAAIALISIAFFVSVGVLLRRTYREGTRVTRELWEKCPRGTTAETAESILQAADARGEGKMWATGEGRVLEFHSWSTPAAQNHRAVFLIDSSRVVGRGIRTEDNYIRRPSDAPPDDVDPAHHQEWTELFTQVDTGASSP